MLQLRDYQREAVDAVVQAAVRGVRRQLVVLPTGAGKTVVAAALSQKARGRVLFLAHHDELIEQAAEKFAVVWPDADVGIVKAERDETGRRIVVASIQTLARSERRSRLEKDSFTLTILDEAHHSAATTHRTSLPTSTSSPTPLRAASSWASPPPPSEPTARPSAPSSRRSPIGAPSPTSSGRGISRTCAASASTPTSTFPTSASTTATTTNANSPSPSTPPGRNRLAVEAWLRYGEGRKTVAFTVTVEHARHLAESFHDAGVDADWVSGSLPLAERRRRLQRLRDGELQVLTNAQLLTEGWDEPSVACVLMARPTRSKAAYIQCVGRGLRPYPGKVDCLVLDLADNAQDLLTFASLQVCGLLPSPTHCTEDSPRATDTATPPGETALADLEQASIRATPLDLLARSAFRWHVGKHRMELEAGPGHTIVLDRQDADLWTVTLVGGGARQPLHDHPLPLAYAQGVAEDWVRAHRLERFADKDAAWRLRPASARQLDTLRSLGVEPQLGCWLYPFSTILRDASIGTGQLAYLGAPEYHRFWVSVSSRFARKSPRRRSPQAEYPTSKPAGAG